MQQKPEKVTLSNICGGAAAERFEHELSRVLENVADPNTDTDAKRSITLKFSFKPNSKGTVVDMHFDIDTKLAPTFKGAVDSAFIAMDDGELGLYATDVRQEVLPLNPQPEPIVTEIRSVSAPVSAPKAGPAPNAN